MNVSKYIDYHIVLNYQVFKNLFKFVTLLIIHDNFEGKIAITRKTE
jgi:hypothetical protein